MSTAVITQSNYIPWKGYFDQIRSADFFVLYDDVQFTRRDWRSRNVIKTKDGLHWLTIPISVKGKFHQSMKDAEVYDQGWAEKHWKSILHSYSGAPHFHQFASRFEQAYSEASKLKYLTEINKLFLEVCCKALGIPFNVTSSSDYELLDGKSERLAQLCSQLNVDTYLSGPAAKDYLDESEFSRRNISVYYFQYDGYPEYPQLHGEFTHNVSVLDLLFQTGDRALEYLHPRPVRT